MALEKQMDMFEEGGLMDEGGTVDPVSGNDVPPGSTQEEVRDDIPAQLSEGEFVFPADVVRYIGLGNLMRMRQEAKMGLRLMEEMGQMGNSDEATIPDDIPFDINDLDTEDEPEYNVGGFVPGTQQQQFGIAGYTPPAAPTTGFIPGQPVQAASYQYMQPQPIAQAPVPTMQQYEVPQFSDFVGGGFGEYDELREYRNEAGQVMMIPFKDGNPISPIPEGYTFYDPEETATEEVTTTPTTPQTTQVREDDPSDDKDPGFSTTDVTGIGYDRSKVTDDLRDVIKEFGFGFGALGETLNMSGAVMDAFGKDPRVKDSSLTSAAFGGVLDAFRGGNVTFSDPNRMGSKTGQYDDNTPLHEMSFTRQNEIARVARSVVGDLRDVFVDADGKAKKVSEVDKGLATLASQFDIDLTVKGTNINKSRTTIAREIAEAKAAAEKARIEKEKATARALAEAKAKEAAAKKAAEEAAAQAAADAAAAAAQQKFMDRITSDDDDGGYTDFGSDSDFASDYAATYEGFGADDFDFGYNAGGLASKKKPKVKKMKRGGLASKK